ncbi:Glutathione S-transferase omega-1 [Microtus ochrogaster]|uniref:Glutathione S-transferase omega-1 n=1 Tax=Microtus ochrogaster TaxID=79684 RepID=A0A8J6GXD2_MICOH|nr:Glutathione S-transferase omega-1 [Microtus ochrogaster]
MTAALGLVIYTVLKKKEELRNKFHKLEEAMTSQKAVFFGGDSLYMIDYFMWPWFQ